MTRASLPTLASLLAALPPELAPSLVDCTPEFLVGEPTDDSRRVGPGSCFIALRGRVHDGHHHLEAAVAAGAGLVIVERGTVVPTGVPRLEFADTSAALPWVAAAWWGRPGERIRLAGITGTNGKTTTSHLLGAVLQHAGRPHLRLGTTGNWLVDHETAAGFTTPFPLELQALLAQALALGARDGVMEVSSHALDQGRVRPLRYRAIALTSFSQDHLDYHPNMADYLAAKCRLASEHLDPAGVALAPIEQGDATQTFLARAREAGCQRAWATARADDSRAALTVVERRAGAGLAGRVRTPIGEFELTSPLVGEFNLDNLLVTVGLAIGLDVPLESIAEGLASARGAPGRLQAVGTAPDVFVDYAHTPDAVKRSIEALRPRARGRLIVVLGCGGDRDASKRPLMGGIASRMADLLVATSDNPRTEDPESILDHMLAGVDHGRQVIREVDRAKAIAIAIDSARADDVVLIAGKGHEDYQIIGTTKTHFDDCEHARAALRARASE